MFCGVFDISRESDTCASATKEKTTVLTEKIYYEK